MVEILHAMKRGYKVVKVYEIHHYSWAETYDPDIEGSGILAQYINTFLKVKQEASGWPSSCTDAEAKEAYIRRYQQHESIRLDKNKIEKNPILRAFGKVLCSSLRVSIQTV